jgi:4-amino-4-deoxy-L-arabinose transferase-like glycosyltransferase
VLLAALVIGLAARALVLSQAIDSAHFANPVLDAQTNWATAQMWASGNGPDRPFFKAPLYPWALGQVLRISRSTADTDAQAMVTVILAQHLIGLALAISVAAIALSLAGWRAGLIAGALTGLAGALLHFEEELLDATLTSALLVFAALLLLCARPPVAWWQLSVVGALMGLAVITRPTVLAVVALVALWVIFTQRRSPGGWLASGGRAGALLLPVAGIVGLVCWANGGQALIATYGGPNFYLANNPTADGFTTRVPQTRGAPRPGEDYVERFALEEAAAQLGVESVSGPEADRHWRNVGYRFWREDPTRASLFTGKRALLFWQGPEIKNNKSLPFVGKQIPALGFLIEWVHWGWIAPLGLVGLAMGLGDEDERRRRGALLVVLIILALFLAGLPFPVNSRYRLPALPFLCMGAGLGAATLLEAARDRRWARLMVALGWLVGLIAIARLDWTGMDPEDTSRDWWQLGNLHVQRATQTGDEDDLAAAVAAFREAITRDPLHLESRVNLAQVLLMRGGIAEAQEELNRVTQEAPEYAIAWSLLGQAAVLSGEQEVAEEKLREGLRLDPSLWPAARTLAQSLLAEGRAPEASAVLTPFIDQVRQDPDLWIALTWVHAEEGDLPAARAARAQADGLSPGLAEQRLPSEILDRLGAP